MKPILRFNFNPSKVDQVSVLKLSRIMNKYQQEEVTMWATRRSRVDKERKFERKVCFRKRIRVGWCVVGSRSFGWFYCCRLLLSRRLSMVVTVNSVSSIVKLSKEFDPRRGNAYFAGLLRRSVTLLWV